MTAPHPIAQAIEALRKADDMLGNINESGEADCEAEIDAIEAALAALEAATIVDGKAEIGRANIGWQMFPRTGPVSRLFPGQRLCVLVLLPESSE